MRLLTQSAMVSPASVTVESSTARLVARLQVGEPSALGELYDEHAVALHAFARRLVGDDEQAKDLVQEVFLSVPSAIRRFQGASSLRTFVMSIAVNHARHHVRAAARRRAAMARYAEERSSSERSHGDSSDGSPEQEARRVHLASLLTAALDALPLEQRVAFVLCEVEERTSREVASIVAAPEATVRTRLHHAKKKLREALSRREAR